MCIVSQATRVPGVPSSGDLGDFRLPSSIVTSWPRPPLSSRPHHALRLGPRRRRSQRREGSLHSAVTRDVGPALVAAVFATVAVCPPGALRRSLMRSRLRVG